MIASNLITLQHSLTRNPQPANGRYIAPVVPNLDRWYKVSPTDREVKRLFRRHLAAHPVPPGFRLQSVLTGGDALILMTHQADALIVFRQSNAKFWQLDHGVQCVVFRNEGHFRCTSLIHEAVEEWAWRRWPGERLFTFTTGYRVCATNPGYCFKSAGWRRCGITALGQIVLELLPGTA